MRLLKRPASSPKRPAHVGTHTHNTGDLFCLLFDISPHLLENPKTGIDWRSLNCSMIVSSDLPDALCSIVEGLLALRFGKQAVIAKQNARH